MLLAKNEKKNKLANRAHLSVLWGKRITKLDKSTILYAIANRKYVEVHVNKDYVFKTSASFMVVEEQLGDGFLRINLSTLAAIRYIREISDKIWLSNGEGLPYVVSNKRRFMKRIVPMMTLTVMFL